MTGRSGSARQPKLPVLAIVATAYRYVWAERAVFLRLALPWLTLGLLLVATGPALGLHTLETAFLLEAVLDMLGYAAVAVVWLRHLVLGEPWPGFGAPPSLPALQYLLWSLILGLLAAIATILVSLPGLVVPALRPPLLIVGALVGIAIAVHLLFVPVGAALGDRPTFAQSARLVRGNAIRIVAGFIMASMPLALAGGMALFLLGLLSAEADPATAGAGLLFGDFTVRFVHYADASVATSFIAGVYSRLVQAASSVVAAQRME